MPRIKRICVYDAELKKNTTKALFCDNYKTEQELQDAIEKVKADQREKNRLYKEMIYSRTQTKISNIEPQKNLNDFIIDENTGTSTVILGSSKRGKSTLMMYIYKKFYEPAKDLISTLFSGNFHIDVYKSAKNLLIGDGFTELSEKYVKMQKFINSKTKNRYHFLNMFDDILDTKYRTIVNRLIMTYRNANISTIMCLQYSFLMSKMNRANVNNIIIFGCNSEEAKKDIIELYLKQQLINLGFKSYQDRLNFFDEVTKDYGFFYLNNVTGHFSIHRIPYNKIIQ